jgi:hypothetical protein
VGVLTPVRVGLVLLLPLGAIAGALGAGASCQLIDPPDDYFSADGVTSLVFYPSSDPPGYLVSAGDYLFFAHGSAILRVPKAGGSVDQVRQLQSGVVSMAYDGQHTIAYCEENGTLDTLDTGTFAQDPDLAALNVLGCRNVGIDPATLAYDTAADTQDAEVFHVERVSRNGDSSPAEVRSYTEAGILDSYPGAVAISGSTIVVSGGLFTYATTTTQPNVGCAVAGTGDQPTPAKVLAFTSPDGGISVVTRGGLSAGIKHFDTASSIVADACCRLDTGPCPVPSPVASPGLPSDFTVENDVLYWSQSGAILRRHLLASDGTSRAPADAGQQTLVTLSQVGDVSIPTLVADDSYVFFVVGARILRAPLPPGPY